MKKLLILTFLILFTGNIMAADDEEVYVDYNGMRFHRYEIYNGINDFKNLWVYFELVGPVGGGQFSGSVVIPAEIPYEYEVEKDDPMIMGVKHTVKTNRGIVNRSKYSFVNNKEVTSITYPESFLVFSCYGCTNLKSVTLPKSPRTNGLGEKIPGYAFKNCENLTTINNLNVEDWTGSGVYREVPVCAFENCKQLRGIDLSWITLIRYSAFRGSGIETVKFSDKFETTIERAAFAYCTKLRTAEFTKQFNMGEGRVGDSLFTGCSSLVSVKGFELLHNRDYSSDLRRAMFAGCSRLTEITLPSNITQIGVSAFEGCESLKTINVNAVLTKFDKRAFMDCKSLEQLPIDWEKTWSFPDSTFYRCHNLDFSDVLHIYVANNHTFGECFKLKNVILSGQTNVIKDSAFIDCHALVNFTYEGYQTNSYNRTVKYIEVGEGGFGNCTSLTQLKAWLSHVKKDGFNGCTNLPSIAFYNGSYREGYFMGEHAFQKCNNLNRVTIYHPEIDDYYVEDGRSVWGYEVFKGCDNIEDVYLIVSNSMNEIATTYGDHPLNEIIPKIDEATFSDNIYKSSTLHLIATHSFSDYYKNAFFAKGWNLFKNVKTGYLKQNSDEELLSYDGKSFYYMDNAALACYEKSDLFVPKEDNGHTVTKIASKAFKDNQWIETIHLPISIRRIGSLAFDNCSSLKSIYVRRRIPIHFSSSLQQKELRYMRPFEGVDYDNVILFVPKDCGSRYRAANEWKRFKHIVETDDVGGYWKPPHDGTGSPIIDFFDELTEEICVQNWDINSTGFLSVAEAERVGSLRSYFKGTDITAFCELSYFTELRSIDQEEFADCVYLDSITIPKNIYSIGEKAFSGCNNLKKVFTKIQSPKAINDNVFTQTAYEQAWLIVPVGKVDTYKATAGWKNFKNIYEEGSEPSDIDDLQDDNPQEEDNKAGDLTNDGEVNGTDIVALINLIINASEYSSVADLNGDGQVNGTDLVALVNIIMNNGSANARRAMTRSNDISNTSVSIEPLHIGTGESCEMTISLSNPNLDVTMMQLDMVLPKGLRINRTGNYMEYELTDRTSNNKHSAYIRDNGDFTRLLIASGTNAILDGNEGGVIRLTLTADDDFEGGNIKFKNMLCTSPDLQEARPQNFTAYISGNTTGIHKIGTEDKGGSIYNLSGQRLKATHKGLNIVNGKKMVVR